MKKANKALIGGFVVGAAALLVVAVAIFGSGTFFKQSDKYVLFFDGSVKGLSEGAPVIFRGVKIGNVNNIRLLYNDKEKSVLISVVIDVELSRVSGMPDQLGYPDYKGLISQGLRAKLEIQNFITGQLMIGLDFYPDRSYRIYGITSNYPELPALPISPDIFDAMSDIPVKKIASDLQQTVSGINRLVNSDGVIEMEKALREVSQAARSVRLLTEYLEQHPEALLKGKAIPKGD
ncbi:MAG: MlaD family protein [Candidatus Omnitrophica bacterium]|nr:MlaD family protein [Candidatus Omnitrophota bacterium]MDD5771171.1 MlaD family protein [Candidatus Omnitrophota bacterium]